MSDLEERLSTATKRHIKEQAQRIEVLEAVLGDERSGHQHAVDQWNKLQAKAESWEMRWNSSQEALTEVMGELTEARGQIRTAREEIGHLKDHCCCHYPHCNSDCTAKVVGRALAALAGNGDSTEEGGAT